MLTAASYAPSPLLVTLIRASKRCWAPNSKFVALLRMINLVPKLFRSYYMWLNHLIIWCYYSNWSLQWTYVCDVNSRSGTQISSLPQSFWIWTCDVTLRVRFWSSIGRGCTAGCDYETKKLFWQIFSKFTYQMLIVSQLGQRSFQFLEVLIYHELFPAKWSNYLVLPCFRSYIWLPWRKR